MKHLRLVILLSIAVIAGLHCSHPSQPTTGLGNQYSIYLTGRVLDKNGNPMANAVAKLADKNLADTTGSDGYYYITEKKAAGLPKTATASVGDSLQILKAGQVITYLDIPKWIDTLPDVFLIQRDIYGSLSPAPTSISRITATITGDSIPDSLAQVAVLGYIPATGNYSGFIYFVYTAQTLNYNVYVSVYNADTVLIGRSMIVTFPSTAGDISMPTFDPNNQVALVAPTLVSPHNGDTVSAICPRLTCNPVIGASYYDLQVSTASDFSSLNLLGGGPSSILLDTVYDVLIHGTTYYWRVRSRNNANDSSNWSPAWSFVTDGMSMVGLKIINSDISGWQLNDTALNNYGIYIGLYNILGNGDSAYINQPGYDAAMIEKMRGPSGALLTAFAIDYTNATDADSAFIYWKTQRSPNIDTVSGYPDTVAIAYNYSSSGIYVYAHFKQFYIELQFSGYSDLSIAKQDAITFLQLFEAKINAL